jgi:polar amino acid transport system substrate-binding protein
MQRRTNMVGGRLRFLIALSVCFALVLAACGQDAEEQPGTETGQTGGDERLAELRQNGVTVAIVNAPPFVDLKPDGELAGLVPTIFQEVMKELGVEEVTPVVATFDSLIPGMQAGQWDIAAAGTSITPERCQEVLFGNPDLASENAVFVQTGNPKDIHSMEDFVSRSDLKLAVVTGAQNQQRALRIGVPEDQLVQFPDEQAEIEAVATGRADAAIEAQLDLLFIDLGSEIEWVPEENSPVLYFGVMFKKEDRALRDAYNEVFDQLKETSRYLEIFDEYGVNRAHGELTIGTTPAVVDPACE